MLKRPLRILLRLTLGQLTRMVVKKHKPHTIIVTGSGQTSITREVLYSALAPHFSTRRNLESPEAEFSLPLTIFGFESYPHPNYLWLWIILKTAAQLVYLKPHSHYLILELASGSKELLDYWLKNIRPEIVVTVGNIPISSYLDQSNSLIIEQEVSRDFLEPAFAAAKLIGTHFGLTTKEIEESLEDFELPEPRIKFLRGKNGRLIIDASYYYSPLPLEAILEVLDSQEGYVLTRNTKLATPKGFESVNINTDNWKQLINTHPNRAVIFLCPKREAFFPLRQLLGITD